MAGLNFHTRDIILGIVRGSLPSMESRTSDAFSAAVRVCFAIGRYLNGQRVYIPSGAMQESIDDAQRRYSQIFDEFDGRNSLALARKYKVSQRSIQRTIVRERQRRKAMRDAESPKNARAFK
jgi:Mor family transcriptional regulator